MTVFDYAVLAIVGLSVLLSVIRGMVREVIALAGWVVAFVVANLFSGRVATWLPDGIPGDQLRTLIAFLILFLVTLLGMGAVAMAASRLVKSAGLGAEDRALGAVFGLARGTLIVMVLVLLAGLTALPRQPAWRNALLSPPLEAFAGFIKTWLPGDVARHITYDKRL